MGKWGNGAGAFCKKGYRQFENSTFPFCLFIIEEKQRSAWRNADTKFMSYIVKLEKYIVPSILLPDFE